MANSNRRRNCLKNIKVNGTWLLEFDSIGVEEAAKLEEMFSMEEVLHKSVVVWDAMEERMRKRLALWKRQFISKGGRITLIRSTLARPFCANGVGVLRLKGIPIGSLLMSRKFGEEEGGWSSRGVREGYGVGLWKEISKEGSLLLNNVSFSVGDGKRVRCVGSGRWDSMGEEGGWTPRFSRPFNDWEVERFLSTIQGKRLNADVEDRMVWKGTKNEIFTVKSLYNSLDHSCAVPFPWSIIWSPDVPTKVGFFCLGSFMEEEETINHILVHCSKAKVLWDLVLSLFGVNWVLPFTVRDTLLGWCASFKDKKHRKVWWVAPLCLF
ncbi:hypothetical protein CK203_085301 [Vitis vinifera]|uniref:Reverse transcriptase zinc-binding domain-containing protein n=1 Tax=Vitis vinifera TaxID=29760 RepID=A0A438DSL9_VITVI|nr:hypothetical protein CK203_085301 [Vitis vinifera]